MSLNRQWSCIFLAYLYKFTCPCLTQMHLTSTCPYTMLRIRLPSCSHARTSPCFRPLPVSSLPLSAVKFWIRRRHGAGHAKRLLPRAERKPNIPSHSIRADHIPYYLQPDSRQLQKPKQPEDALFKTKREGKKKKT